MQALFDFPKNMENEIIYDYEPHDYDMIPNENIFSRMAEEDSEMAKWE